MTKEQDAELEQVKLKLPKDSWFKITSLREEEVWSVSSHSVSVPSGNIIINYDQGRQWCGAKDCTPCVVGVWRCCESDRPKITGEYHIRKKKNHKEKKLFTFIAYHDEGTYWNISGYWVEDFEWLDEGGAE